MWCVSQDAHYVPHKVEIELLPLQQIFSDTWYCYCFVCFMIHKVVIIEPTSVE